MLENRAVSIVKASAGSGKTFRLTLHYISVLLSGFNKHKRIMAVTFTNKATAEMKERILGVLEGLAKDSRTAAIESYREKLLQTLPDTSRDSLRADAERAYLHILHDYSNFAISTIDTFVQKVVRSFGHELGMDTGYRIETNRYRVIAELTERLHTSLDERPDLTRWIVQLAKRQIRANKSWNYERVLAQVASEIFSEPFWDFEQALNLAGDEAIFIRTFETAQKYVDLVQLEIYKRIMQINKLVSEAGVSQQEVAGKSRHAVFLLSRVRKNQIETEILQLERLWEYAGEETKWLPKKSKKEAEILALFHAVGPLLQQLQQYYEKEKATYFLSLALVNEIHYLRLIVEMSRLLAAYRREHRVLLISDANRLLNGITREQGEHLSFIWEKTGVRYQHFLMDEFQDTSVKQWANFKPLIKNAISEWEGPLEDHLLVGDVKQSIYRWRNGDWRILHQGAESDLGTPYVKNEQLAENYRSAERIVTFNNKVFQQGAKWLQLQVNTMVLKERGPGFYEKYWVEKTGYDRVIAEAYAQTEQQVPQKQKALQGFVEIQRLEVQNNSRRGTQAQQEALQQTADRLYAWIVEEKRYRPAQIGILVRNRKHANNLIDFLSQDLIRRNAPEAYQVISGDALLLRNNNGVKLLVESLRFLQVPVEEGQLYRARCIFLYRQILKQEYGDLTADQWLHLDKHPELLPGNISGDRERLEQMSVSELVEYLIEVYRLNGNAGASVQVHLPYLLAFRDIIDQYTQLGDGSIQGFMQWWDEEQDACSLPVQESDASVQVMTIHKAKGLAFDVVMLPFLDWKVGEIKSTDPIWVDLEGTPFAALQQIPLAIRKKEVIVKSSLALRYFEEWMLRAMDCINEVYVAFTRARKHLFMNLIESKDRPNSFIAGDIVRFALEALGADAANLYDTHLPDPVPETEKQSGEDPEDTWVFDQYAQGSYLKQSSGKEKAEKHAEQRDTYVRRGTLAHHLLARVDDVKALDAELTKMQKEGLVLQEEISVLRNLVCNTLEHPELKALQEGATVIYRERPILDTNGNIYRPDKILIKGDRAIVIDFKFTGSETPKHRKQVQEYQKLLSGMHYKSVSAFLFYGNTGKLIEMEGEK